MPREHHAEPTSERKTVKNYNRNLLEIVQGNPEIRGLHLDLNVLGLNPLNPTSALIWTMNRNAA